MVYCSEHLSLAALEILVHTQPVILRDKFRAFRVVWDDRLMTSLDEAKLPRGWNAPMAAAASRQIGDGWIKDGKLVVLAVPSVIVPQERTFLINPRHSDFRRIKIVDTGRFALDPRLR
jgi:RES domain-containing protein